jgi:hypothetical protein
VAFLNEGDFTSSDHTHLLGTIFVLETNFRTFRSGSVSLPFTTAVSELSLGSWLSTI